MNRNFYTPAQYYHWLKDQWNYRPATAAACVIMRFSKNAAECKKRLNAIGRILK